ncbi:MAG: CRAL-TRIO domain-containing protein [Monoraphidium minutum]|nr:MAG: CRAL-TRIO domain-containing protein [Monoraphidium minutum]
MHLQRLQQLARGAPRPVSAQRLHAGAAHAARRGAACRAQPSAVEAAPGLRPEPWIGNEQQQQALAELRGRMQECPLGCPDDETLKWYLRDRYFIVEDAETKLTSMLRWRKEEGIDTLDLSTVQAELATGKAEVHEHTDRYGRPVIIIRVNRHVTGEFPLSESKRLCAHVLDGAVASLPPGGEQMMGVFDLKGFELKNADLQFAGFLVEAFFEYYPRRMGQVLMVDAPWIFQPSWAVIKPLLRKYAALVRFVDRATLEREFFEPGKLPEDLRA